jgi:hypothetical protein
VAVLPGLRGCPPRRDGHAVLLGTATVAVYVDGGAEVGPVEALSMWCWPTLLVVSEIDGDGIVTTCEYDAAGRRPRR